VFEIRFRPETGSTNDDASRLLGEMGGRGVVLWADYQRAGRARRARTWLAPPGSSLLFTAILPRTLDAANLWAVPFWTALGVADGIEAIAGVRVDLQWPNDLLLERRKCCGILSVSRVAGDRAWVGCGVGLNVARPGDDPELAALEPPPAFLSDRAGDLNRGLLLHGILEAFERHLDDLDDAPAIARRWESRAALDGTPYHLLPDGDDAPFEAVARRLGPDGRLIVERDGAECSVGTADARVVR